MAARPPLHCVRARGGSGRRRRRGLLLLLLLLAALKRVCLVFVLVVVFIVTVVLAGLPFLTAIDILRVGSKARTSGVRDARSSLRDAAVL